ncbi:MAG: hypothetical protein ABSH00_19735 [Bryobacteraceae bacterium]|jgi:hypothetical protein
MADLKKIKERISELVERRENVTLSEIKWVVDRLGELGYRTSERVATHGRLFGVASTRFMVNCHDRGNKQVKAYSVDSFADAMIELGLYEH